MVWWMPANCKAGMYCTPSLDATHVVPQKKHTIANAKTALAFVSFFLSARGLNKATFRPKVTMPFNASLTLGKLN